MERIAFFKKLELFKSLAAEELERLAERMEVKNFSAGDVVIRKGDAGDAIYFILKGAVKVRVPGEGDIATLGEGDFFGEMALLTGAPRSADVVVEGELGVLALSKENFDALVASHPHVRSFLTDVVASRLSTRSDTMLSKEVGSYRILDEIARGGMGIVYKGEDAKLNREVAVKMLPHELVYNKEFIARFQQEAKIIAGLNHDNIVKVYDMEEAYGTYFIMMEYVKGRSLKEIVKSSGALPIEQARDIILKVASALAYAHDMGIVHRDVKSANIMLDAEGKVKLMDFGIARAEDSAIVTQTGTSMGTPTYMSPEQAMGKKVDKRADIYSFGCVAYEMLTGKAPFEGEDAFAIAYKHVNTPVTPPVKVNPQIPADLNKLVMDCLVKNKDKRLSTLKDLEARLEESQGAKVTPGEETKFYTEGEEGTGLKKAPSRRAFKTVLAVALVIIVAGLAWQLLQEPKVEKKPLTPPVVKPDAEAERRLKAEKLRREKVAKLLARGNELFQKEAYEDAITEWKKVLVLDSANAVARKRIEEAKRSLSKIEELRQRQEKVKVYLLRGDALFQKGLYADAIAEWSKSLALDADNVLAKERIEEAKGRLSEIQNRAKATESYSQGVELMVKRAYKDAIVKFEKAVSCYPKEPEFYYQLGLAAAMAKDKDKAVKALEKAVKLAPKHTGYRYQLALAYYDLGLKEKAVKTLQSILEIAPTHSDAHNMLDLFE